MVPSPLESLQLHCQQLGLTTFTQNLVLKALSGEPLKSLKSNLVRGVRRYASKKNKHTVQVENTHILGAVLEYYELAPRVLRYLDSNSLKHYLW